MRTYIIDYLDKDGNVMEYKLTTNYSSSKQTVLQNFAEEVEYSKIISFYVV